MVTTPFGEEMPVSLGSSGFVIAWVRNEFEETTSKKSSLCYMNLSESSQLPKPFFPQKCPTHLGQNPNVEWRGTLVDFSRNLTYPRGGSKTNICEKWILIPQIEKR